MKINSFPLKLFFILVCVYACMYACVGPLVLQSENSPQEPFHHMEVSSSTVWVLEIKLRLSDLHNCP